MSKDQSTALEAATKSHVLAAAVEEWGQERIRILKETICPDLNNGQLALFLEVCSRKKLDPFARQIYAVTRNAKERVNGEWRWTKKMTIQTGIDGFRTVAQRTGAYRGQVGPYWCGDDGKWVDVWLSSESPRAARVGVLRADFSEPLYAVALFDEYKQTDKNGNLNSMWSKFTTVMLAKCAEALALRKAFPEELSGLYTSDEIEEPQEQTVGVELSHVDNSVDDNIVDASFDEPPALPAVKPEYATDEQQSALHAEFDRLGLGPETIISTIGRHLNMTAEERDNIPEVEQLLVDEAASLIERLRAVQPKRKEKPAADESDVLDNCIDRIVKCWHEDEIENGLEYVRKAGSLDEVHAALQRYAPPSKGDWASAVWAAYNDAKRELTPPGPTPQAEPSPAPRVDGVDGPETMKAHLQGKLNVGDEPPPERSPDR